MVRNLILMLLFFISNFHTQVRKFDIKKFNESLNLRANKTAKIINKDYRWEDVIYEDKDNTIKLSQQGDGNYREEVRNKNSVYKMVYIYYQDTYTLAYESKFFQITPIGIEKTYSKEGKVINEKDNEKAFRDIGILTREEIVMKMKNKFKIDVSKEDELKSLMFFEKEGRYIYKVVYKPHPERGDNFYYAYFFDAKTGKFLNKDIFTTEE